MGKETVRKEEIIALKWKSSLLKKDYEDLSLDAKIFFIRLEDKCKHNENCFVDKSGCFYFISKREKLCEIGGASIEIIEKIIDELKEFDLLAELIMKGGEIRLYMHLDYDE
jgi:hypothetical protein